MALPGHDHGSGCRTTLAAAATHALLPMPAPPSHHATAEATTEPSLENLLQQVRACTLCAPYLPLGPHPVLQAGARARILIASQAPGRKAHATGIPFDDASGERLRHWLQLPRQLFYERQLVAILPMGFCYPGQGASGDAPPRPECAPTWRTPLLAQLAQLQLTLAVGRYAIAWHLPEHRHRPLAEVIRASIQPGSKVLALPHPSPRNNIWLRQHPWFEAEALPLLRQRVAAALHGQI